MKEVLKFKNPNDFQKKINESKEFRIRIQKLVYLSKFFGWENTYHFNLHKRGPYSIELSKNYHDRELFAKSMGNYDGLDYEKFNEFLEDKNTFFLEATSTILYYTTKITQVDENTLITILKSLKPNITDKILLDALEDSKKYHLIKNHETKSGNSNHDDAIIKDKINGLKSIFEEFEVCSNQTLILGSLEYLELALKKGNIKDLQKKEFNNKIYEYVDYIEYTYFKNANLAKNFAYCDISLINEKFDKLQNYISDELNIIPRLYDENIDLNVFCE